MQIGIEHRNPWTVIQLHGNLDAGTSPAVYHEFRREFLHGGTRFRFDLRDVGLVDSSGLGVLVRCYRDARSRGGDVCLSEVPSSIGRVLQFTRLDAILKVIGDEEFAALDSRAA